MAENNPEIARLEELRGKKRLAELRAKAVAKPGLLDKGGFVDKNVLSGQIPSVATMVTSFLTGKNPATSPIPVGLVGAGADSLEALGRVIAGLDKPPEKFLDPMVKAGKDFAKHATYEMAGNILGKVTGKGLDYIASRPKKIMNQALGTTKNSIEKGVDIGQEAVNRGTIGTTEGLLSDAVENLDKNESALQALLQNADGPIDKNVVINELSRLKNGYLQSNGAPLPGFVKEVEHIDSIIDEARKSLGMVDSFDISSGVKIPGREIPATEANVMKRAIYDKIGGKGYLKDNPSYALESQKALARGFKRAIEGVAPSAKEINKELKFYGQLKDAMNTLIAKSEASGKMGKALDMMRVGGSGGIGYALGGPVGAALGAGLSEAAGTTVGKTTAAQALNLLNKAPWVKDLMTAGASQAPKSIPEAKKLIYGR